MKSAFQALQKKLFNGLSTEERIHLFLEEFKEKKKYPAMKFFEWHNKLTGNCEMGRKSFARNNDIDLENGEYSVEEFINLTKNNYGGEVIKELGKRFRVINKK